MDITVDSISKAFEDNVVLDKVKYVFRDGEITCIMGPSGAGKTTLFNIMMGLMKPDSGVISGIEGRRISAVFQEDRLCEGFTAVQNIKAVTGKKYSTSQIENELEELRLSEYKEKPASELSGGMKRRVAILRSLMSEADIIFMDEPFKGLDESLKNHVISYVKNKTKGRTVIIITHDMTEAGLLTENIVNL